MDFETRAIHDGQEPDPATGAVIVPIYQTSTFAQDAVGQNKGYEYARVANPTRTALQICLASLESAEHGVAFASGMAASRLSCTWSIRTSGSSRSTTSTAASTASSRGVRAEGLRHHFFSPSRSTTGSPSNRREDPVVWLETPTNPLLNVIDIEAAEAAHAVGAMVVVDNTFATPYLQRRSSWAPTSSSTRRRSTSAATRTWSAASPRRTTRRSPSACTSSRSRSAAFRARSHPWLVLRGLKTLPLRMERHSANARRVAEYLESHQSVEQVRYPGLPSHPGHEIAKSQ